MLLASFMSCYSSEGTVTDLQLQGTVTVTVLNCNWLDWFNFFASAPGLSVFTTANPGAPKPTHAPFEVLWNCYPRGYISTSAKENSVDKFFSLWVLQEHGCSKSSQRTEQLIAVNGNQLIVSLRWFSPLLSLPGHWLSHKLHTCFWVAKVNKIQVEVKYYKWKKYKILR